MNNIQEKEQSVSVENRSLTYHTNLFSSKLFLANIILLGVLAVAYALLVVFDVVLSGIIPLITKADVISSFARTSSVILSGWGYIVTGLIYVIIPTLCAFSLIEGYKLFTKSNTDPVTASSIDTLSCGFRILHVFSLLYCIDRAIMAIVLIMTNITDYKIIMTPDFVNVFSFCDIESLYQKFNIAERSAALSPFTATVTVFAVAIVLLAYSVLQLLTYRNIRNYYSELQLVVDKENYKPNKKAPLILPAIFAGCNVIFAVLMFINGSWISAIINLAIAGYVATTAAHLFFVHKAVN